MKSLLFLMYVVVGQTTIQEAYVGPMESWTCDLLEAKMDLRTVVVHDEKIEVLMAACEPYNPAKPPTKKKVLDIHTPDH